MPENLRKADILVVGGGASGMAAAIAAAERLQRAGVRGTVVLAERQQKLGRKLLATGNGRCNLSNVSVSGEDYSSRDRKTLELILSELPPQRVRGFFENHGLLCDVEEGRVYPYSYSAAGVLEVLWSELQRLGVEVAESCCVTDLVRTEKGFQVSAGETVFESAAVILAAGGPAAPQLGGCSLGGELAGKLGHTVTGQAPALTAFTSSAPVCPGLKGLRARAQAVLASERRVLAAEKGEIQFTEYGISGIPAFQLSRVYAVLPGRERQGLCLYIDLFPEIGEQRLLSILAKRMRPGLSAGELLQGTVSRRLAEAALKLAGIPWGRSAAPELLPALVGALKNMRFPVTGTLGWEHCQVTLGGVPLSEIDPLSIESRRCRGLYLTGELLEPAGKCGGYNLHWAFGTGILAGEAAAEKLAGAPGQGRGRAEAKQPRRASEPAGKNKNRKAHKKS